MLCRSETEWQMLQQGFSQVVWLLVWRDALFLLGGAASQGQTEFEEKKFFEDQALMKDGVLTVEEL
jgi:hypothetical protein